MLKRSVDHWIEIFLPCLWVPQTDLVTFLIQRGRGKFRLANYLYWFLQLEAHEETPSSPEVKVVFSHVLKRFMAALECVSWLSCYFAECDLPWWMVSCKHVLEPLTHLFRCFWYRKGSNSIPCCGLTRLIFRFNLVLTGLRGAQGLALGSAEPNKVREWTVWVAKEGAWGLLETA